MGSGETGGYVLDKRKREESIMTGLGNKKAQDSACRLSSQTCSWNLGSLRGGWRRDSMLLIYHCWEAEPSATGHFGGGLDCSWDYCSLVNLCLPGCELAMPRPQCSVPGSSLWLVCSLCSWTEQMSVCFFLLRDGGRFPMIKIQFHIFWNPGLRNSVWSVLRPSFPLCRKSLLCRLEWTEGAVGRSGSGT